MDQKSSLSLSRSLLWFWWCDIHHSIMWLLFSSSYFVFLFLDRTLHFLIKCLGASLRRLCLPLSLTLTHGFPFSCDFWSHFNFMPRIPCLEYINDDEHWHEFMRCSIQWVLILPRVVFPYETRKKPSHTQQTLEPTCSRAKRERKGQLLMMPSLPEWNSLPSHLQTCPWCESYTTSSVILHASSVFHRF